jgi:hypothetical protein
MTNRRQVGNERLILQMDAEHQAVVAHDRDSVQEHAEHRNHADPLAQAHLQGLRVNSLICA